MAQRSTGLGFSYSQVVAWVIMSSHHPSHDSRPSLFCHPPPAAKGCWWSVMPSPRTGPSRSAAHRGGASFVIVPLNALPHTSPLPLPPHPHPPRRGEGGGWHPGGFLELSLACCVTETRPSRVPLMGGGGGGGGNVTCRF